MLGLMFVAPLIAAWSINDPISTPSWLNQLTTTLKLGNNWGEFIGALCVLAIILAALYDILSFTAFESVWVKTTIAIAIAIITTLTQGVLNITRWALSLAGAYTTFGVVAIIVIAITFFVIASFFTGKLKMMKAKRGVENIKAEGELGAAVIGAGAKAAVALGQETINVGNKEYKTGARGKQKSYG